MSFLQPSLMRRMVIAQIMAILVFSLLLVSNLLWEFTKQGEGEFDKQLIFAAKSLAWKKAKVSVLENKLGNVMAYALEKKLMNCIT